MNNIGARGFLASVCKLIKEKEETPSNTVQLPIKIRPLLRKFQVGLWPNDPPSPTGPIIEYTQTYTRTYTQTQTTHGAPCCEATLMTRVGRDNLSSCTLTPVVK